MSDRKYVHEIYASFRQSINTIKIETEIYHDYSKCVNCETCESKYFSKLAELRFEIKNLLEIIEYESSIATIYITQALDTGFNIEKTLEAKQTTQEYQNSLDRLIKHIRQTLQQHSVYDGANIEYTNDLVGYELERLNTSDKLVNYDKIITERVREQENCNLKARQQALAIEIKHIPSILFNLQVYFIVYSHRIVEISEQLTKYGRRSLEKMQQCYDDSANFTTIKKLKTFSYYYTIIHRSEDSTYKITMPDFPGITFEINTINIDELSKKAQKVIELWCQNKEFDPQPPLSMEDVINLEEAKSNNLMLVQINFDFMEKNNDTTAH